MARQECKALEGNTRQRQANVKVVVLSWPERSNGRVHEGAASQSRRAYHRKSKIMWKTQVRDFSQRLRDW